MVSWIIGGKESGRATEHRENGVQCKRGTGATPPLYELRAKIFCR